MRCGRKKPDCFLCAAAVVLIGVGAVWLCYLSYRFLLIFLALLLIGAGLILKRNCRRK